MSKTAFYSSRFLKNKTSSLLNKAVLIRKGCKGNTFFLFTKLFYVLFFLFNQEIYVLPKIEKNKLNSLFLNPLSRKAGAKVIPQHSFSKYFYIFFLPILPNLSQKTGKQKEKVDAKLKKKIPQCKIVENKVSDLVNRKGQ